MSSATRLPFVPSDFAPLEAPPVTSLATSCDPTEKPGAVALRSWVLRFFPELANQNSGIMRGIVRGCSTGDGQTSEHTEGRAWDFMCDLARGEELTTWLLAQDDAGQDFAMARRAGVMYAIHNRRIWSAARAAEGWRDYHGADPHVSHVHVSLTKAAGAGALSFYAWLRAGEPGSSAPGDDGFLPSCPPIVSLGLTVLGVGALALARWKGWA